MAVKRCIISTERYKIDIVSYHSKNQTVDVYLVDGSLIVHDLRLLNNKAICLNPQLTEYYSDAFYYYIKSIVNNALEWIELWTEMTYEELIAKYNHGCLLPSDS